MQMDHIIPCVPKEGWVSVDDFADKLYCEESNFQSICSECHDIKSALEGQVRKVNKKRKKSTKKKKKA